MSRAQPEIAFALSLLGDVAWYQGADAEVKQLYGESLTINTERGNLLDVAYALCRLGWVAEYQGEFREAKRHFQESLAFYQELKHKQGIAHSLDKLAAVAFGLGEYAAAERTRSPTAKRKRACQVAVNSFQTIILQTSCW